MKLMEASIEHWINLARKVATDVHNGQKRSDGSSYITHPEAVAAAVEDRLKPIALLHDVIEEAANESDIRLILKVCGFPSYIIDAVELLTHKNNEPNIVYWKRILTNPDAVNVKLQDIKHNISDNPTEHQKQKYIKALELFKSAGYTV